MQRSSGRCAHLLRPRSIYSGFVVQSCRAHPPARTGRGRRSRVGGGGRCRISDGGRQDRGRPHRRALRSGGRRRLRLGERVRPAVPAPDQPEDGQGRLPRPDRPRLVRPRLRGRLAVGRGLELEHGQSRLRDDPKRRRDQGRPDALRRDVRLRGRLGDRVRRRRARPHRPGPEPGRQAHSVAGCDRSRRRVRVDGRPSVGVIRIDPTTNAVVARIPLQNAGWTAASTDAVWITSPQGLVRIDPATDQIVATVPFGGVPLATRRSSAGRLGAPGSARTRSRSSTPQRTERPPRSRSAPARSSSPRSQGKRGCRAGRAPTSGACAPD